MFENRENDFTDLLENELVMENLIDEFARMIMK